MARRVPRLPLCAVIGWGCPKRLAVLLRGAALLAGSRGCVGRSLRVRARTRCTEGLASALDGAARYLTLHISIVPLRRWAEPDRQPRRLGELGVLRAALDGVVGEMGRFILAIFSQEDSNS